MLYNFLRKNIEFYFVKVNYKGRFENYFCNTKSLPQTGAGFSDLEKHF